MIMILAVWTFQIAFGFYILFDAFADDALDFAEAPELKIGLTRFVCGVVMHMSCNNEF